MLFPYYVHVNNPFPSEGLIKPSYFTIHTSKDPDFTMYMDRNMLSKFKVFFLLLLTYHSIAYKYMFCLQQ